MSNNRWEELWKTVDSVREITLPHFITIYDSGGRREVGIRCVDLGISYVDTASTKTARDHFQHILNRKKGKIFIHHDDDLVNPNIYSVKEYILQNGIKFACSPKRRLKDLSFRSMTDENSRIEYLLDLYFLSTDGNCPLVSGLFIDNTVSWSFRLNFQYPGIYADVGIICDLISRKNGYLHDVPYIKYNDESLGENSERRPQDKKSLADFARRISESNGDFYYHLIIFKDIDKAKKITTLFRLVLKNPAKTFAVAWRKVVSRWRYIFE